MVRNVLLLVTAWFFLCSRVAFGFDLAAELAKAQPGAVVDVPAGAFPGGLEVPAGVTLRGAGYERTTIEARGKPVAIRLQGQGARIEGLTVVNTGTGIEASAAVGVAVSRVMVLGGSLGIRAQQVMSMTIENVIVARAQIGISLNGAIASHVANCTVFGADACGLSVSSASDTALLNNLIFNAGTGVVVGGENKNLALDYNLYVALAVGKIEGQLQRPSLPTWRDVSGGLDAHSVQLPVTFASPSRNDFHPVSTLPWNPARITTADWGVAELAGYRAPATDLDGQPRVGPPDLGAYEAPQLPGRPADGQFQIAADEGLKSAGLFTTDDKAVAYLFQGLPLRKGTHDFVWPARDLFGRPIPAGSYELRVVESPVAWAYRGMAANAGAGNTGDASDSVHVGLVAYTSDGQLLTASGWSERGINLRLGDPATGKAKWVFDGSADTTGLCVGGDGQIYLARNGADKSVDFYRIDPATGTPNAWPDGRFCLHVPGKFKSAYLGGIAELGGKLFVADTDTDQVFMAAVDSLSFQAVARLPQPRSPAADRKRNLLWLVSNREQVVALDIQGRLVHEFTGVPAPLALGVAGDRLAVASAATGQIHLFDLANSAAPTPAKTLGRGDGPYGKWLPDRFHFQAHPRNLGRGNVAVALAADGSVTVRDASARVVSFDPSGHAVHDGFAVWGGDPFFAPFAGGSGLLAFDSNASVSYRLDPQSGRWEPDAYWGLPPMTKPELRGFFSVQGKNFGVLTCPSPEKNAGESIVMVGYDQPVVRAAAIYQRNPAGGYLLAKDTNRDGVIDQRDEPGTPVLDSDGKPVTHTLSGRFMFVNPDGTICHSGHQLALIWKPRGVDEYGAPIHEFAKDAVFAAQDPLVPSPYFADKSEDLRCVSSVKIAPDGGLCAALNLRHTLQGMGLSNSGATDLARWNPAGQLRWLRTTNDFSPIQGVACFPDVVISSWGAPGGVLGTGWRRTGIGPLRFPGRSSLERFLGRSSSGMVGRAQRRQQRRTVDR